MCCYLERKRPLDHPRVLNQVGDQILRLLVAVICPLRFQSPIVKDTKKAAQRWHEGTKQPIRQLREQHYRTMN